MQRWWKIFEDESQVRAIKTALAFYREGVVTSCELSCRVPEAFIYTVVESSMHRGHLRHQEQLS